MKLVSAISNITTTQASPRTPKIETSVSSNSTRLTYCFGTDLLPLNCSESSPTCLTPQRLPRQFILADSKPFRTTSETRNLDDNVTADKGSLGNENNNANVISNVNIALNNVTSNQLRICKT